MSTKTSKRRKPRHKLSRPDKADYRSIQPEAIREARSVKPAETGLKYFDKLISQHINHAN